MTYRTTYIKSVLILFLIQECPTIYTVNQLLATTNFVSDSISQQINEPPDQLNLRSEYDFIIVGAGTAGCVLANRLSEVPEWNVLLIEAGQNENLYMDIPLFASYLQFTPANWDYKTKPSNRYCTGFEHHQCRFPRGKVMGGSSVLNYMIYTRGAPQDYDQWKNMGNIGWGWDDVLPYFKKVENYKIPSLYDTEYHSRNGYLNVEYTTFRTFKSKAWVKAAQEYGIKYGDYNGKSPSSVSFLQLSLKNGTRHSSSTAYLHPINRRRNLHVSKNSLVTKLMFEKTRSKVIGVEFEKDNVKHKIKAAKEVILSAGAINSPQLLMLSGIGPTQHLEQVSIPVVKNLSVGHNLMDHIATGGIQFVVNENNHIKLYSPYVLNHVNLIFEWMEARKGPLAVPGGLEALAFINLEDKYNSTAWPDVELLFVGGGLNADPLLRRNFGFDDKIYMDTYGPLGNNEAFMIFPMLMRPKSKGRIELKSNNPKEHPTIIPNYLSYSEDVHKLVEGIKVAIDIANQPSLKRIGSRLYTVPIRRCLKKGPFGSDAYFACQAQMFTFNIYHQSGTCKMGPKEDPTAVVDPRLRVHGIDGLRVIDVSVMPEITSGHTNAPTYMIAEKGSDMIKEDWLQIN